jgi:dCMP deaminase
MSNKKDAIFTLLTTFFVARHAVETSYIRSRKNLRESPVMISPLDAMQAAVDIVLSSPHPTNKIAAAIFAGDSIAVRTNGWPGRIEEILGTEARIGRSSGTVHAEVTCLLDFSIPTDGASLCVTDPFCPNCAKNIAEAGIKRIYIDHKGFDKDFALRRGSEFQSMSLRITARAGISIYEARRKEGLIVPILEIPAEYKAPEDNPIKIETLSSEPSIELLRNLVESVKAKAERWGCAFARNQSGRIISLIASAHATIGYSETSPADREKISHPEGKYNFYLEPMNRLMMGAARYGCNLIDGMIYASCIPTAREQVNMVAAGVKNVYVGDISHCRDEDGLHARSMLEGSGILNFHAFS